MPPTLLFYSVYHQNILLVEEGVLPLSECQDSPQGRTVGSIEELGGGGRLLARALLDKKKGT